MQGNDRNDIPIIGKEKSFEGRTPRMLVAETSHEGLGRSLNRREGSQTLSTALLGVKVKRLRRFFEVKKRAAKSAYVVGAKSSSEELKKLYDC